MREPLWVFTVILSLVWETWINYTSFNVGSDVKLKCSDKSWQELIYVIWTVALIHKQCRIANSISGGLQNNCNDGKTLRNTSMAQPYLHIPDFSSRDVGLYKCELVYSGGSTTCNISVSITVPPRISSWLEWGDDNSMVAVCKAEEGKPAATITWSHMGNFSSVEKQQSSNGFFSVESRLKLPEGARTVENVTCIIRHLYWQSEKKLRPKPPKGLPYNVMCILIVVAILMVLAGFLIFAHKKKIMPRCLPGSRSTLKPQPEVGEEVEPYATYVQRVNSIYNSNTCVT
ncbi:cell surface glycoprotein CD200 receptor 1 isoform X2 [Dunckerocampus dactyliophorus]|uniref:cell surface glycoprotein CD200 receptor 1 isoform X2 n=1 Tax=Dunckerocampus dactyliophorus TaxID=161453 RepID=UPI002406D09E|nr:cell surface glycoprotein CD200 receptor 1 isoform X2 [Dunckerocampus dactyliophorus]